MDLLPTDNKQVVELMMAKAKKAQKIIAEFNQQQIDAMVKAIGKTVYEHREILSREAVDETRLGLYENKVAKHISVPTGSWAYMRDKISVGVIDDDPVNHVITLAKPMGVVVSVTPSTNPTTTATQNCMMAIKSGNAVIVCPHPRAKACTSHCVELINSAIQSCGGPADLVQTCAEPSIELTGLMMAAADVVVATGGNGMVKAAYSCGKPSFGVGQGCVQAIIDPDYSDISRVVRNVIANRTFDNGMPCTGEQALYIPSGRESEILSAFQEAGAFIVTDEAALRRIRETTFVNGQVNRDIVGKTAVEYAAMMDIDVPAGTKLIMLSLEKCGIDEPLAREIMLPMVRYYIYDDFKDAVAWARANYEQEGAGHSAVVYSENDERILYAAQRLPVGRVLINQSGGGAAGNTSANGLNPTMSVGCGSWGNNTISENVTYRNLMNVTKIAYLIDAKPYDPEEIFA